MYMCACNMCIRMKCNNLIKNILQQKSTFKMSFLKVINAVKEIFQYEREIAWISKFWWSHNDSFHYHIFRKTPKIVDIFQKVHASEVSIFIENVIARIFLFLSIFFFFKKKTLEASHFFSKSFQNSKADKFYSVSMGTRA